MNMGTATQPSGDIGEKYAMEMYASLREYEHHFNKIELEIRKLASAWLLAVFGGIAFIVRGQGISDDLIIGKQLLIPLLCLLGSVGLFTLWIQDYVVYHGLLRAVFMMGLRLEHKHPCLPPLRSLMMAISGGTGMGPLMKLYYQIPMAVFAAIAAGSSILSHNYYLLIISCVIAIFPVWISIQSSNIHGAVISISGKMGTGDGGEFSRMYDPGDKEAGFDKLLSRL